MNEAANTEIKAIDARLAAFGITLTWVVNGKSVTLTARLDAATETQTYPINLFGRGADDKARRANANAKALDIITALV